MVFVRLITRCLILLAFVRPRLRDRPVTDWWPVLALGFALGAMNWAFYEPFASIPLGVAVTIEFVGPLLLAAVGSRWPRDLVWVGLAAIGITLFDAGPPRSTPSGSVAARRRLLGAVRRLDGGHGAPPERRRGSGRGQHGGF